MTIPASPAPGVYHSRSRVIRNRLAFAAAGLALVLLGYLIGRLQGGAETPAAAALPVVSSPAGPAGSPAEPSPSPSARTPGGSDAYAVIQAEAAAGQQGTQFEQTVDEDGGQNVGWISSGDWLRFDDVEFGDEPATTFAARVASDAHDGGRIEIRLDSLGNAPAGTLEIEDTGGWQKWESRTTDLEPTTGRHTVFLTFGRDGSGEFVNLNHFTFGH